MQVGPEAFKAMITLQFNPWETPKTAAIFRQVAARSAMFYNYTYRPDEMVIQYVAFTLLDGAKIIQTHSANKFYHKVSDYITIVKHF